MLSTYLAHGGDIDARNARVGTPLQIAHAMTLIDKRCATFLKALFDRGAHMNVVGRRGSNVHDGLMKRFKAGAKEVLEILRVPFTSEALHIDAVLPLMCLLSHRIVEEGLSREHLPLPARRYIDLHDPSLDLQ